jgi:hypothetical protein
VESTIIGTLDEHGGHFGRRCSRRAHTKETTLNRDPGVWTYEDCALALIDHQEEMFEAIRSETPADLVELNVRLLAKTAKAFDGMRPI